MIFRAPLAHVMQEQRDVKSHASVDGRDDFAGDGMVFRQPAGIDIGENADGAQQVLIHGVVMIHIELHHRDNAAKIGDEAAQNASLVHHPQNRLGRIARRDDF